MRERETEFVIPPIYAFIVCFLYIPWLGITPATLACWDDAQTNWAAWPGLYVSMLFINARYWRPDVWVFFPDNPKERHAGSRELRPWAVQTCCCEPALCAWATLMANSGWAQVLTGLSVRFAPPSGALKARGPLCARRFAGTINKPAGRFVGFEGRL